MDHGQAGLNPTWHRGHHTVNNANKHACGANIGWINLETMGSAKVDLKTGVLSGSAYSANCGWISLSNTFAHGQSDSLQPGLDSDEDGIEVESDCLVVGNHSVDNGRSSLDGAGIRATGSENRIDGNNVAQNDLGILINDSTVDRNWVVRNTARKNSGLNYVIPAGNRVGIIAVAPISGAISGDTSSNAHGAGTTDPWANFSH